ncbi:MAG: DUF2157 domain-containing protein [Rhizobiaceae bacterium]
MASYAAKVTVDIARWRDSGLIDAATADKLAADVLSHERRSLSFGTVLATLAALLFGAAILIFVAANWEGIPRLARVAALFATLAGAYVGGALLKRSGHPAMGEAAWLVGAAAFGASIALVSQMYHMSGEETDAILTWSIGTALAAVMLRSGPLTIAAVALSTSWMFTLGFDIWGSTHLPYLYPLGALTLWLISHWTQSAAARHLILLSMILWAVLTTFDLSTAMVGVALVAVSAAVFAAAVFAPANVDRIAMLDGRLTIHGLLGFLAGIALIQVEAANDSLGLMLLTSIIALGGIVAALLLAGRSSRGLRWLAYIGFAFELCFIYTVTMGTMLGTAGFLLAAALILGGVAFAIIRIEKRMKPVAAGAVS